jgi:hypothetical protein
MSEKPFSFFEKNDWDAETDNLRPDPWERQVLGSLPNISDPDSFWNDLADFLAIKVPSILDPRTPATSDEICNSVIAFCKKQGLANLEKETYLWLSESLAKFLKRISIERGIQRLSLLLRQLGLEYVVDSDSVIDYLNFTDNYDISHLESDPEWLQGSSLIDRWHATPKKFAASWNSLLPSHLWNRQSAMFECVTRQVRCYEAFLKSGMTRRQQLQIYSEPLGLLFCVPQWRYFRREHVEFFEKLHPSLSRKFKDRLSHTWFSFSDLVSRWQTRPLTIEEAVRKKGLKAYLLSPLQGIIEADDDDLTTSSTGSAPPLKMLCLFARDEIQHFEQHNKKSLGLNERSLDRLQARELVTSWVKEDPGIRTGEAVARLRATRLFDHLSRDETLKTYIRSLIKNRVPGPRKRG